VHENLLSEASDFFRKALNGNFKEASDGVMELPEDDPNAFELFVRWLYGKALAPASTILTAPDGKKVTIQDYLRLYVLASKLMMEDLENTTCDIAHEFYNNLDGLPDLRDVQYIYEHTLPDAGLRRLLQVHLALGLFKAKLPQPLPEEWREVLDATAGLGYEIIDTINSWKWVMGEKGVPTRVIRTQCCFHRHEKGLPCEE
jgi:hypothetical protein